MPSVGIIATCVPKLDWGCNRYRVSKYPKNFIMFFKTRRAYQQRRTYGLHPLSGTFDLTQWTILPRLLIFYDYQRKRES